MGRIIQILHMSSYFKLPPEHLECYVIGISGFDYIPPKSVNLFVFGEYYSGWTQTVNCASWEATAVLITSFFLSLQMAGQLRVSPGRVRGSSGLSQRFGQSVHTAVGVPSLWPCLGWCPSLTFQPL